MELATDDLLRVLSSLTRGELARLRGGEPPALGDPDTPLTGPPLGLDSIELLELAGAVNRQFHLHETGIEDYLLRRRTLARWAELVGEALARGAARVTFHSSGSSGAPKPCTHAWKDLHQEARHLATLFDPVERVLALVPAHHIYGLLFTVLLPRALGRPVLDQDRAQRAVHGGLGAGDLIVAFPLRWRYLADSLERFPAAVAGVTSTAPCDPALIRRLRAQGLAAMTEVYGASETGGLGARRDPDRPYRLFPYWTRLADGRLQRPGRDPLLPMDHLEWVDGRHFWPRGRRDGAVQVAGSNVSPERVAALLKTHPGVADCAVRPMRPGEGERLKAFVVPVQGIPAETLGRELGPWLAERLSTPERPGRIDFGAALPVNAMGKSRDW